MPREIDAIHIFQLKSKVPFRTTGIPNNVAEKDRIHIMNGWPMHVQHTFGAAPVAAMFFATPSSPPLRFALSQRRAATANEVRRKQTDVTQTDVNVKYVVRVNGRAGVVKMQLAAADTTYLVRGTGTGIKYMTCRGVEISRFRFEDVEMI